MSLCKLKRLNDANEVTMNRTAAAAIALAILALALIAPASPSAASDRRACDATTCPDGCCAGPICRRGRADDACGAGRAACVNCRKDGLTCEPDQECIACDACLEQLADDSYVGILSTQFTNEDYRFYSAYSADDDNNDDDNDAADDDAADDDAAGGGDDDDDDSSGCGC
jgi:hypothetical protein